MARIIDAPNKKAGSLDYVGAWFIKAGAYINNGGTDPAHIAFVSTNSITQGEMVAQLWPILFQRYHLEISFAHRTFEWGSDAKGKAHVHCVIIGLSHEVNAPDEKRLFAYESVKGEPEETQHKWLSPYLFDASGLKDRQLVVREALKPINGAPLTRMGTKPVVGQHYLFNSEQKSEFLSLEPKASKFMRPFLGSREYLNGKQRFILHLSDVSPTEIKSLPYVQERISRVRKLRSESSKKATQKLANYPTQYEVTTVPKSDFLVLPEVSSERREYIPFGWLSPPCIPSNKLTITMEASTWLFALINSKVHMSWVEYIGGRLKSDYSYSTGIIFNTFPWPVLDDKAKATLTKTGQAILDARAAWPEATLADLYDPDAMPANLRLSLIHI